MPSLVPRSRFSALRAAAVLALGTVGIWKADAWRVEPVQAEFFRTPTPHEAEALSIRSGSLADTRLGRRWLAQGRRALSDPLPVAYAHLEEGRFVPSGGDALGFRVGVERGQRLEVDVGGPLWRSGRLFLDVFRLPPDSAPGDRPVHLRSVAGADEGVRWEPDEPVEVVVRLQPALLAEGDYEIRVRRVAALEFPVTGRDHEAILSIFGAPREAGRRSHHGVDIFAPRGTPVLAATDAVVRRRGDTRLGGRVIWLRDSRRSQSLYYAHLERQLVFEGQRVEAGDTIGLVGNSGNARTTPPHLHFGIYRRGRGPVDPYPYIRVLPSGDSEIRADRTVAGSRVTVRGDGVRIRAAPSLGAPVLATVDEGRSVPVVGVTGEWYRVRLDDGTLGFLAEGVSRPGSAVGEG